MEVALGQVHELEKLFLAHGYPAVASLLIDQIIDQKWIAVKAEFREFCRPAITSYIPKTYVKGGPRNLGFP